MADRFDDFYNKPDDPQNTDGGQGTSGGNGSTGGDFSDGDFRTYEDPQNTQPYTYEAVSKPKTKAWEIASLTLGILSLVCCCTAYGAILMGALAIVFAIISRKTLGYFDAMTIAGLVLGIIGLVIGVSLVVTIATNWEEILKQYEDMLKKTFPDEPGQGGSPFET